MQVVDVEEDAAEDEGRVPEARGLVEEKALRYETVVEVRPQEGREQRLLRVVETVVKLRDQRP